MNFKNKNFKIPINSAHQDNIYLEYLFFKFTQLLYVVSSKVEYVKDTSYVWGKNSKK